MSMRERKRQTDREREKEREEHGLSIQRTQQQAAAQSRAAGAAGHSQVAARLVHAAEKVGPEEEVLPILGLTGVRGGAILQAQVAARSSVG